MSIAQKALQFAIRPLLNERHRTGFAQGRVEGQVETQHEWETWLRRQQDAGATWSPTDPPPGSTTSA